MISAEAFYVVDRARGEIRGEILNEPGPDEVLVDTLFSGISRGTELTVYRGLVPPSEYERMRAPHQGGEFPWPVKYGYSNVGRVRSGDPELEGKDVLCLYPHQTAYVVPRTAVVPLPRRVPTSRAVLAPNVETALNVLWDAGVRAGDRVAVVGAGVVGGAIAYLASRHPGTDVELVDVDPSKARLAEALGVRFSLPAPARGEADVVIHASGTPEGLDTALCLAAREATVVEASWFGDRPVTLNLGRAFHSRRLRIVSSQVGSIPEAQRARWTHRRRLEVALGLLADPTFDALVSAESAFAELPQVMARLHLGEPALCHRVVYGR
ncbi:MAG TPA: zinc-binding alcohol dehydrogenase [Polyangiaceae bacterium]|nr:zinc-binding alcohol dehydrogenase [Polyangiaceae bacterium]